MNTNYIPSLAAIILFFEIEEMLNYTRSDPWQRRHFETNKIKKLPTKKWQFNIGLKIG